MSDLRTAAAREGGVLLVDKPGGMTSHDVVARVRRAFATREVGHAGTLDPMATGLLVVLVGSATRLSAYATADAKRYRATIAFGRATDTLDAEGTTTSSMIPPHWLRAALETPLRDARLLAALDAESARVEQAPPLVSAISIGGERAHAMVRRGESPDLPVRAVVVHSLTVLGASSEDASLSLDVHAGKGYYVRALARDLGLALGVPAHLAALRRVSSGRFSIDDAAPLSPPEGLLSALLPVRDALSRMLTTLTLTEDGARRARLGQPVPLASFAGAVAPAGVAAWVDEGGTPIAIGEITDGVGRVRRGFPT